MRIAFTLLLLAPSIATAQQVPPAVAVADSVFNRGEWATARRLYTTLRFCGGRVSAERASATARPPAASTC